MTPDDPPLETSWAADDAAHFATIDAVVADSIAELTEQLAVVRRSAAGGGRRALDRDQEAHRITARLRTLRRFGADLCLGRMDPADGTDPIYLGRLGLSDRDGNRLLIDWRTPAAEPFFAATHADPMGLAARRRYRWSDGQLTDWFDEVFNLDTLGEHARLDDQSAFIASLAGARTERMRDVLATIQTDQDAIIRASSAGVRVVDGGPGTGKTVVALHRAAYLMYADPRLGSGRGGVLFVGPHQPYLRYVSDVLPSLGEEGVSICTIADLTPEGADAGPEPDPRIAAVKGDLDVAAMIDRAISIYQQPPTEPMEVATAYGDVWVSRHDWIDAFGEADPALGHNENRELIWQALLDLLAEKAGDLGPDVDADDASDPGPDSGTLRAALAGNATLRETLTKAWPLIAHTDMVGDLWSVPAYLRLCAPELAEADVRALQRSPADAWTVSDLPLLDLARQLLGDVDSEARQRRNAAEAARRLDEMDQVVQHLIETDDTEEKVMSMLRGDDLGAALIDPDAAEQPHPGRYDGPFAHVIVDEAQELTDAEWQMLLARCPARSFTVVGDRAQARNGFTDSWAQRMERVGLGQVEVHRLTINYRTPAEIMAAAAPVITAALPDANVPTSVRESGKPVRRIGADEWRPELLAWLAEHPDGLACVISTDPGLAVPGDPRVRLLTPALAKGLEFDLVLLIDPDGFDATISGAVDRYVAMTRATSELILVG